MGTSLSGLTPATTFDGLLKTSDNDAITSSLKTIGSGDGTDSCLQLSDSALKVNSGAVTIVGTGATSATTSLLVQDSGGNDALKVTDDRKITFDGEAVFNTPPIASSIKVARLRSQTGTDSIWIQNNTANIGLSESNPTARLHVKVGTTQDSIAKFEDPRATTDYIEIKNDSILTDYTGLYWGTTAKIRSKQTGAMFLDCTSGILFADGNSARSKIDANGNMSIGSATIPASTRVTIQGQGATSATTSLLVQNSDGTEHLKITDDGFINARQSIIVNHSTNSSRSLRLGWGSVYATDNASELQFGAVYTQNTAPKIILGGKTRASGADAVLVQALNGMYLSTTASSEDPSAQLHVKGSGATSATTALLVENSSGTDTLEVRDDGRVVTGKGATTNANGTFNVLHGVSNLTTRVFTVSRDSVLRGMDINSGGATKISDSSGDQSFSHTATAVLEVSSTTQGFLPPRMTGTQRDAIESPASGLIIYNTTTNKAQCYNGTSWNDMF